MVLLSTLALPDVFREIMYLYYKTKIPWPKWGRRRLELVIEGYASVWGILVLQNAPEITVPINMTISLVLL